MPESETGMPTTSTPATPHTPGGPLLSAPRIDSLSYDRKSMPNCNKCLSLDTWANVSLTRKETRLLNFFELHPQEELEKKRKAEYAKNMNNKIALKHKAAREKRAMVEAKRGEGLLKAEELDVRCQSCDVVV